jgi:hypothetical protein
MTKKQTDADMVVELVKELKETITLNLDDILERMNKLEEQQGHLNKIYRADKFKEYMDHASDKFTERLSEHRAQVRRSIDDDIEEIKDIAATLHKQLQAQMVRSATFTEVMRFISAESPKDVYPAFKALLDLYDRPDKWWLAAPQMSKRVVDWAVLFAPHMRKEWLKKFGRRRKGDGDEGTEEGEKNGSV